MGTPSLPFSRRRQDCVVSPQTQSVGGRTRCRLVIGSGGGRRRTNMVEWFIVIGVVTLALLVDHVQSREVRILQYSILSYRDLLLNNHEYFSAYMLVPIAIKHFNERYSKIIPAIESARNCNVNLTLTSNHVYDTEGHPTPAMSAFMDEFNSKPIDVIHGLTTFDVAQAIGLTAGALNIPVVSPLAPGDQLSNKRDFPTLFRLVTTDYSYADMTVRLLQFYNYTTAGILFSSDSIGTSFKDLVYKIADERGIRIIPRPYNPTLKGKDMYEQLAQSIRIYQAERINVLFHLIFTYDFFYNLAQVAYDLDFIDGKMHISHLQSSGALMFAGADENTTKKVKAFMTGSLHVVRGYDLERPEWLALKAEWPHFNVSDVNPFLPNRTLGTGVSYYLPEDFFLKDRARVSLNKYHPGAQVYDSIIAIGLAACGPKPTLKENLANLRFNGTTGMVVFDGTYDRVPESILFALENVFLNSSKDATPATFLNHVEVGRVVDGNWTLYKNPHPVYSGGRLKPPVAVSPPRHDIDRLPFGAKVFGWIEASIAIASGVCMFLYVIVKCTRLRKQSSMESRSSSSKGWKWFDRRKSAKRSPLLVQRQTTAEGSMDGLPPQHHGSVSSSSLLGGVHLPIQGGSATTTQSSSLGSASMMLLRGGSSPGFGGANHHVQTLLGDVSMSNTFPQTSSERQVEATNSSPRSLNSQFQSLVFLGSIAVGCTLLAVSIVPLTLESNLGCMMFHWTFAFGFLLTMSSLSVNSVRVAMVWAPSSIPNATGTGGSNSVPSSSGSQVTEKRLLQAKMILVMIAVTVLAALSLLIAWQVLTPFQFALDTSKRDAEGYPLHSSAVCVVTGSNAIFFILLCVDYFIALVLSLGTSYWVRNAPEVFQEARMNGVAGFCMFQVFFVGVPAAAAVWSNALPRFLVLSSVTFVLCMVLLFTVFLPQVFNWKFSAFNFGSGSTPPSSLQNQNRENPSGGNGDGSGESSKKLATSGPMQTTMQTTKRTDDEQTAAMNASSSNNFPPVALGATAAAAAPWETTSPLIPDATTGRSGGFFGAIEDRGGMKQVPSFFSQSTSPREFVPAFAGPAQSQQTDTVSGDAPQAPQQEKETSTVRQRKRPGIFKSLTSNTGTKSTKKSSQASSSQYDSFVGEDDAIGNTFLHARGGEGLPAPTPATFGSQILTPALSFAAAASTGVVRQESAGLLPLLSVQRSHFSNDSSANSGSSWLERMTEGITAQQYTPPPAAANASSNAATGTDSYIPNHPQIRFLPPPSGTLGSSTEGLNSSHQAQYQVGMLPTATAETQAAPLPPAALPGFIVVDPVTGKGTLMLE